MNPSEVKGEGTDDIPRKRIVLGVCGGIAAYKALDLTSTLTRVGHQVSVVLTADAQKFVTPLAFKTLSRNPVVVDLYDEEEGWRPVHIRLADEADLLAVVPATASTLARLAHGLSDDALVCIALALRPGVPVLAAPAMNGKMWEHPATQDNIRVLKERGVSILGPDTGILSCGYEGVGRLWPVEGIVEKIQQLLESGVAGKSSSA